MSMYERFLAELTRKPWVILPSKLDEIQALIALRLGGDKAEAATLERFRAARDEQAATLAAARAQATRGSVALIPVYGAIGYRMNMMMYYSGGTSIQQLTAAFRQAMADPNIGTIVLDIDSPGGSVEGVPELADEILKAREDKRIIAVSNCLAASAAYWLASACSEVVVTPSGEVGSIGVYVLHWDYSGACEMEGTKPTFIFAGKHKVDGNPYEPLEEEARAAMQADVDRYYDMFCAAVAKGRGAKVADVKAGYGEGRCVGAREAVALGMADRVASLDQVLGRLGVSMPAPGGARADATEPTIEAGAAGALAAPEASDDGPAAQDDVAEQDGGEAERRRRRLRLLELS
ncbi:MAG TPA: S49 family peptidase [Azospirillum sp.]|nr:S49 family peptidase [Azospirillum sp.]